jgi:hypothetical protein
VSAFWGLLGFNALALILIAAGIARGHAAFRRKPKDRKPTGGTS